MEQLNCVTYSWLDKYRLTAKLFKEAVVWSVDKSRKPRLWEGLSLCHTPGITVNIVGGSSASYFNTFLPADCFINDCVQPTCFNLNQIKNAFVILAYVFYQNTITQHIQPFVISNSNLKVINIYTCVLYLIVIFNAK